MFIHIYQSTKFINIVILLNKKVIMEKNNIKYERECKITFLGD